jgi:propionyl-CoA carboxylase alpha chain
VVTGSEIGVHYDPMLAKVIAWAPSRSEAARSLASALRRAEIHGVVTNRDLLVRVLDAPEFLDGGTDTAFLGRHPEVFEPLVNDDPVIVLAAALSRVRPGPLPSGWRNVGSAPQTAVFDAPWGEVEVAYRFDRTGALAQSPVDGLVLVGRSADTVTVEVGGVRRTLRIHNVGDFSYVDTVTLREKPRFAPPVAQRPSGSLLAPMPGAVGTVAVAIGQAVAEGDLLLTLEAMKMEHAIRAPRAGTVTQLQVAPGDQVEAGAILAVVTTEEEGTQP